MVKNPPAMQETQVQSLGQDDSLEKRMATHSSILAGEFHGRGSLAGYSPWGCKESDMTEQLTLSLSMKFGRSTGKEVSREGGQQGRRSIGCPFNGEKTVRVMAAEVQPKERGGRVLLHLVQWRHQERLDKPALFLALSIIDGKFLPLHLAFLHRKEPVFGIAIW